ncbi:hypothetical protein HYALB_00012454 [Hymenoscyphus albidus]|uniref:Uncharacterized protein n=1 Tax=Hymenoscyphus albidus TaxID=595503 RepID=A0A9N9LVN4_9HELO|nr:hypothetical protein HYALB_00012454 [Hymenoscyphus albidus]
MLDFGPQILLGNLKRAKIIIEIRESGSQQDTENTIHRIRWEQLEDQELWPRVKARIITVRRVTSQNNVIGGPATITLAEEATYRKEKG